MKIQLILSNENVTGVLFDENDFHHTKGPIIDITKEELDEALRHPLTIKYDSDKNTISYDDNLEKELCNTLEVENIRNRREGECFSVINRGSIWHDSLSADEKEELKTWYQEWLDAPATKQMPSPPPFVKI